MQLCACCIGLQPARGKRGVQPDDRRVDEVDGRAKKEFKFPPGEDTSCWYEWMRLRRRRRQVGRRQLQAPRPVQGRAAAARNRSTRFCAGGSEICRNQHRGRASALCLRPQAIPTQESGASARRKSSSIAELLILGEQPVMPLIFRTAFSCASTPSRSPCATSYATPRVQIRRPCAVGMLSLACPEDRRAGSIRTCRGCCSSTVLGFMVRMPNQHARSTVLGGNPCFLRTRARMLIPNHPKAPLSPS
eukprot:361235-Chlamydomonas_euryale.AAC.4